MTPKKSPEPNAVLSGRSFGAEADGAGQAADPGQVRNRLCPGFVRKES
jgi:hypothetical protein